MARVLVVTDSACDLPQKVADENNITIVPLSIRFGDEELMDRRDLTPELFWRRLEASPVLPSTAAPAPGAFQSVFQGAVSAGYDGIVCVNLSAALSATLQAAQTAATAVSKTIPVRVVDSRSVSMGQGMIVLGAARAAARGDATDAVASAAEDLVTRTRVFGALDSLENLKKGGRIGGAAVLVGSLLSIKPIIEVRNGVVEAESRQRTRSRSLRYLVDKVLHAGTVDQVAVLHGDAPDLTEFLVMMEGVYERDRIVIGDIGPVIGTHVGPGAIGVVFQVPPRASHAGPGR